MAIEIVPEWMTNLDDEDVHSSKDFSLHQGHSKKSQIYMVYRIRR